MPLTDHVVSLIRTAGIEVAALQIVRVDRDEWAAIGDELVDRVEHRPRDAVIVSGRHEDHGRTILVRSEGVFSALVEEAELVRSWGAAVELDA